jgi:hypothetical protein
MRKRLARTLVSLAYWLAAEYGDDVVETAVRNVSSHVAKKHREMIEAYLAVYYNVTNISPEEAQIVIEWDGTEWTLHIDPRPQDWEEELA